MLDRPGPARLLPRDASPPVRTALLLGLAAAVYGALDLGTGSDTATPLAASQEWVVWRLSAAGAVVVAAVLGVDGAVRLARLARQGDPALPEHVARRYLAAGAVVAAGVLAFLVLALAASRSDLAWPIPAMQVRLTAVSVGVAVTALPWLALVWCAHRVVRRLDGDALTLPRLLALWDLVGRCVLAFSAYVVVALLPTGALRALWLARDDLGTTGVEAFSSVDVLLYGAFWAVLLAGIALPLVTTWQHQAQRLLDREIPYVDVATAGERLARREPLERVLHLDHGLLRNPLAGLSLLTPLVTTLLAAFLPELAQG